MGTRKFTKEEFEKALANNDTIHGVLIELKLSARGGSYKSFYRAAKAFGIDVSSFVKGNKSDADAKLRKQTSDERIVQLVANNRSYQSILATLGLTINSGGNNRWIRTKVIAIGLNTDHFTGQGHLKGKSHNWGKKQPLSEILIQDSDYSSTVRLKIRLIRDGLLKNECYECGLNSIWNDKPIVLQIDHINGDNRDNRIENLRILCPNCHSQTNTFCSRGRKSNQ